MNFSCYTFGTPNGYDQYPSDTIIEQFGEVIQNHKNNSQLIVYRQNQLIYYTYVKRGLLSKDYSKEAYWGMSIVVNGVCFCDVKGIYALFDMLFSFMISKGEIIKKDRQGKIVYTINRFVDKQAEVEECRLFLQKKIDEHFSRINSGYINLDATFNQTEDLTVKSLSVNDVSLSTVDLVRKYRYVVITSNDDNVTKTICDSPIQESSFLNRYDGYKSNYSKPFPWKVLTVAVTLIITVFVILLYNFYLVPKWRDEEAPRYYTVADDALLRSSPIVGVDYNIKSVLAYGTELITYNYDSEWCQVKVNGEEGFVATKLILDKKNFYILNSIFGDQESRASIGTVKCRIALLKYFKDNNYLGKMDGSLQKEVFGSVQRGKEIWQVFSKGKDVKPNTVSFPDKIVNPNSKFSDFAVIIKNMSTNKRKFLLFTFSDAESPNLVSQQDAPDYGYIWDVKRVFRSGASFYDVKYY